MYFVQVSVNTNAKNLDRLFTYALPENLQHLEPGHRVIVPFAARKVEGFIIDKFRDVSRLDIAADNIKEVLDVVDREAWFNTEMLATAHKISKYYLCTLSDALQLFLVGQSGISKEYIYSRSKADLELPEDDLLATAQAIGEFGPISYEKLKKRLPDVDDLHEQLAKLLSGGYLHKEQLVQRKFSEKTQKVLRLSKEAEQFELPKRAKKQIQLIEALRNEKVLTLEDTLLLGISRDTIRNMLKIGILVQEERRVYRDSYVNNLHKQELLKLNEQQQHVLDTFTSLSDTGKSERYLLHGITGSGKTEIYISMCRQVLEQGRQVLVLVPEIALTGQIVKRFQEVFQANVVVSHSRLSQNERLDVYAQLRENKAQVLIGARSAVFAPFCNPGLIIIDEEHEQAYTQDTYPPYNALRVAAWRCGYYKIPLVLGSATPGLERYYHALKGDMHYFYLDKRANSAASLPEVVLVDMRKELENKNYSVMSGLLKESLQETLGEGRQAIILLNRRGFSTFVMCRDCGYVVKCQNCDVSMVYHKNNEQNLTCHYCGYTKAAPAVCPNCNSHKIKFFGSGTQKLEDLLQQEFPQYKTLRMDQDTTGGKFGHAKILQEFAQGRAQVLIGTQMVAKGHDFPNVTLVGILAADAGLNIPDYRSAETTFALLTQMSGRAGRAENRGRVLIQTYNPEHEVMQFVKKHDYVGFASKELQNRKIFNYPPYSKIMKIKITDKDKAKLEAHAEALFRELKQAGLNRKIDVLGPFYGVISRIKDIYAMYILCKGEHLSYLKEYCYNNKVYLRKGVAIQVDPTSSV